MKCKLISSSSLLSSFSRRHYYHHVTKTSNIRFYFKRLLLFAIILALIFIVLLTVNCPQEVCSSKKIESISIIDHSRRWIDENFPVWSFQSSSSDSPNGYDIRVLRGQVDRILSEKFGFDYGRYARHKSSKIWMIDFDRIKNTKQSNKSKTFDMTQQDVMVFMHIQKTGGSAFDRHLVRDLILPQPCICDAKRKKKCRCYRPGAMNKYWLFSRYSIGWKCGLHADYTELTNCVDRVLNQIESNQKNLVIDDQELNEVVENSIETELHSKKTIRRYYFVTLLRDPIARFISEFKHVQRGATWKTSRHWCDGRLPTRKELPLCFHGSNWKNVTLEEFIDCPHNLAFNRQTRMLADLDLVSCYNSSAMTPAEHDAVLLFSAKHNLRQMSFFGLCEEQLATQYMFEKMFDFKFQRSFVQFNQTRSRQELESLSHELVKKIHHLNRLDIELYSYARKLFRKRFALIKERDSNFTQNYQNLLIQSQAQMKRTHSFINKSSNIKSTKVIATTLINKPVDSKSPSLLPINQFEQENHHTRHDDYDSNDGSSDNAYDTTDSVDDYYSI